LLDGVAAVGGKAFDVVIFFPATEEMGVTQERVAVPSMWTVQAPQSAMPQPKLGTGSYEGVAENQRRGILRTDVHGLGLAVQSEANGHATSESPGVGWAIRRAISYNRCGGR